MKYILILAIAVLGLTSCQNFAPTPTNRITLKESTLPSDFRYEIIEVDGVEYIATSRGGICPLVTDTTNNKNVFKIN